MKWDNPIPSEERGATPDTSSIIPDEYGSMETAGTTLDPWVDAEDALTHPP